MRRSLALGLAALVAVTAACSTTKDDESSDTTEASSDVTTAATTPSTEAPDVTVADTTPSDTATADTAAPDTEAPESTLAPIVDPRAPGVTDTEIKVGITYPDFRDVRAVTGLDHGDYEAAYNAVIDDFNAAGGVNGRTITPVFAPVNPLGTDGAASACTKLTQDEQVFVAIGFFRDDDVLCYIDTNGTATIGGAMTTERLAAAKAPWYTTDPGEDQATQGLTTLVESGILDGTLGVVGIAGDEANYESTIKPLLEANGVEPVDAAYIDVSSGDIPAIYTATETIAERFDADGVDQVLMIGASGAFFPTGVSRTDARPQLIFADMSAASAYTGGDGNDLSVMENAVGAGQFEDGNVFLSMGPPTSDCVELMTAAGIELKELDDITDGTQQMASSLLACRFIGLLGAILENAGPDVNYGTYQTAGNSLGEIMLAGAQDPYTFGPPRSADGDPPMYIYKFDPATGTMQPQDA